MKIIEIADFYNNKTGNPLSIISEGLKKKGLNVIVFTSTIKIKPEKMSEKEDKQSIVPIKRFKGFKFFSRAIYPGVIFELLKTNKNTIIHSHVAGFFSTFISAILKPIKKYKLIINSDFDVNSPNYNWLNQIYYKTFLGWLLKKADLVICWTELEKKELIKRFKIKKEKIKVIPIGYFKEKITRKTNELRKKLNLKNKFIILNTNILVRKKNLELIINAIKKTKDENIVLIHAGGVNDSKYKKELDALIKKEKMQKQVIFLGKQTLSEIYALYPQADIFVNSGFRESFAITIVEAMASGTPVISTKVGIAPEVIIEGKTGFFAETETELAKKIMLLKKDKKIRKKISITAKEKIKKLEWEKIIKEYIKIFNKIKK